MAVGTISTKRHAVREALVRADFALVGREGLSQEQALELVTDAEAALAVAVEGLGEIRSEIEAREPWLNGSQVDA